ncbi:hypothetical protein ACIRVF_30125 [Kitasatospora sp. NPDC101157]|uniref:hypothetical protein n=1 Tax=Kitasatospora sp. NPDC101157 TaxID=3364098 RepID=UPI00381F25CA
MREVKASYLWNPRAKYGDRDSLVLINLYGLAEDGTMWVVRQNPKDRYTGSEPQKCPNSSSTEHHAGKA